MELREMFVKRRSYRRYDESRPVPQEAVRDMKTALRMSSSGHNRQPFEYIFIQDPERVAAVFEYTYFAAALPEEQRRPPKGKRPVMYVAVLKSAQDKGMWTEVDMGIALSNLTMAAWGHGVGSCIFGNIDRKKLAEILGTDESVEIACMVCFGYPVHFSEIIDPREGGNLTYYVDEDMNFYVPKRREEDFIFEETYPGA